MKNSNKDRSMSNNKTQVTTTETVGKLIIQYCSVNKPVYNTKLSEKSSPESRSQSGRHNATSRTLTVSYFVPFVLSFFIISYILVIYTHRKY